MYMRMYFDAQVGPHVIYTCMRMYMCIYFDVQVGPHVAAAPVHSAAYRRAMAELQSFRRVPRSEQGAGPRYAMVAVEGGGAAHAPCERCGAAATLEYRAGQWFCGAACLKAHRRAALAR